MENQNSSPINVKVLREQLERLSNVKDVNVKNLSDQYLDDFTSVSHNISELFGTDGYNLLFKEIQAKFSGSDKVKPGTVSGYFLGCFVPSDFKYGDNCSLSCITGAPAFYDSTETMPCQRNVYIAPFDGENYTFTRLSSGGEDPTSAIVFIQAPFKGLNYSEMQRLKSEGIQKVIFSYYDDNKSEYYVSDPLPISQINIRKSSPYKFIKVRNGSSAYNGFNIYHTIVFIFLLIIAGYAIWNMRNN